MAITALLIITRGFIVIQSKETAVHASTYGGVRGRQRYLISSYFYLPLSPTLIVMEYDFAA